MNSLFTQGFPPELFRFQVGNLNDFSLCLLLLMQTTAQGSVHTGPKAMDCSPSWDSQPQGERRRAHWNLFCVSTGAAQNTLLCQGAAQGGPGHSPGTEGHGHVQS